MKTISGVLLLVALIASSAGCASREKLLVGKWMGKVTIPDSVLKDPKNKLVEAILPTLSNLPLELKEDKTFTLNVMGPLEGTWSVSGDVLSLKVEKIAGMAVDEFKRAAQGHPGAENVNRMSEPMAFRIAPDSKTLTAIPKGGAATDRNSGELVFTRSES